MIRFWREVAGGIAVLVKVQPRSRRPGVRGLIDSPHGERLRIAVADPPEDGRANRAACAMLAEALGLPGSAVRVTGGATTREKTLHVAGDPRSLTDQIARL